MKNIINFDDFINESLSSDNDLNIIADALISKASNNFLKNYEEKTSLENEYKTDLFIYKYFENTHIKYDDYKYSKKLSKEFLKVFKQSDSIYLVFLPKNSGTEGRFSNRNIITLFISYNDTEKEYSRKEICETPNIYNLNRFFKDYKSTIIHELQHYLDYWRSLSTNNNGDIIPKYIDKNIYVRDEEGKINYRKGIKIDFNKKDDYHKYLKFTHEISARYSETLNILTDKKTYKSFNELLKDFKNNFDGWNVIDETDKQRLIKRLTQYFFSIYKDKSKQDITEILKDFSEKNNVYLNVDKHIDLYDNDIYKKDYKKIIPMLIKISDIYRYDITIYPYNKDFSKYLKSIGFVENKGRNTDYSKRVGNYIYYSKR